MSKSVELIRSYTRNGSFPLDKTSLFFSKDDALNYAHNDPSAYASQIITIDDKDKRHTGIYQLDYDPSGLYKYILVPVGIGNGSGSRVFNFKGSVETYNDLNEVDVLVAGDLWAVKDESSFYVVTEETPNNFQWEKIDLGISFQYVDNNQDGILKKEIYRTFTNHTSNDAVWFNRDGQPTNNGWIQTDATDKEKEDGYTLVSRGTVKRIIGTYMDTIMPELSVICDLDNAQPINELHNPTFNFTFKKNAGGLPKSLNIWKIDTSEWNFNPENPDIVLNFEDDDLTISEDSKYYYFSWEDVVGISSPISKSYEYIFFVKYDEPLDGAIPSGFVSSRITISLKDVYFVGYNYSLPSETTKPCFIGDIAVLSLDPSATEEHIENIFVKVPVNYNLKSVTYAQQNDSYAKDYFKQVTNTIDNYVVYCYWPSSYINNDGHIAHGNLFFRSHADYLFEVI